MSATQASERHLPRPQLQCELLEARCVLDGATWTVQPHAGLLADTNLTVAQNATEPSTALAEAPPPAGTQWQGGATFPILVTALLVTLCGQVELFGGRKTGDAWTTPLL